MSFRFHRRKSLLGDLVRVNMSRGGLSVALGVPGARITIPITGRSRKPHVTAGVPGTGISYTERLK